MKKFFSALFIIGILISTLVVTASADISETIKLGDYILLGEYYNEPILWRCVSFEKISGYDEYGNPIIDSTDTRTTYADGYLPLFFSDKVICAKSFDARGNNELGSHGRGITGSDGWKKRHIYGSNYWGDSNIRDWLNSDASANNIIWTCGNPPDKDHVAYNAYDDEAGFLANFKQDEKMTIETVTQKSILDAYEQSNSTDDYNVNYYNRSNYSTAYCENITDRIFLLDVKQKSTVYDNQTILGDDYFIGIPTAQAVYNGNIGTPSCTYWLRTPCADYRSGKGTEVYAVSYSGRTDQRGASNGTTGVRPAFFLNLQSCIYEGSGTSFNPYKVSPYKTTIPTALDITYEDRLNISTLSGGSVLYAGTEVEGEFSWKDGEKKLSAGEHNETVIFTPNDKNYEPCECTVKVRVNKKFVDVKFPTFTQNSYTIGTKLLEIPISNTSEYGIFSWKNANQEIVKGENVCEMIFTPYDTANYNYSITTNYYTFVSSVLPNTIVIENDGDIQIGSPFTRSISISSPNKISAVVFDVEYPLDIELTSISKQDFDLIDISEETVKNGINVATITAQYSNTSCADENIIHTLSTLNFTVKKTATVGEKALTIKNVYFYDDEHNETVVTDIENSVINVTPKLVESIAISGDSNVYDESQYIATIYPDYASNKSLTWSVSDETVAMISQDGKLTALKNGTITVTVFANDGSEKTADKVINVYVYAKINTLTSDIGKWNRKFSPTIRQYTIFAGKDAKSVGFIANFTSGSLRLNGTTLMLNKVKKSITLDEYRTVITLNRQGVEDNNDSTYTITIIKDDFHAFNVQQSIDGTQQRFNIAVIDDVVFDKGILILAGYNDDGLLTVLKTCEVTTGNRNFEATINAFEPSAYFKVMLFDSFEHMIPIADSMTVTNATDN